MNSVRHVHAALDRFARRYLFADAAPLSPHERWRSAIAALLGVLKRRRSCLLRTAA